MAEVRVGGGAVTARFCVVDLACGEFRWDAEVGFCDPWPYSWGLLGHDAFFRFFTATFRAADFKFEVAANQQ